VYGYGRLEEEGRALTLHDLEEVLGEWLHGLAVLDKQKWMLRHIKVLRYEDLLEDPERGMNSLFHFLGYNGNADALLGGGFDPGKKYVEMWEEAKKKDPGQAAVIVEKFQAKARELGYDLESEAPNVH